MNSLRPTPRPHDPIRRLRLGMGRKCHCICGGCRNAGNSSHSANGKKLVFTRVYNVFQESSVGFLLRTFYYTFLLTKICFQWNQSPDVPNRNQSSTSIPPVWKGSARCTVFLVSVESVGWVPLHVSPAASSDFLNFTKVL